jgi:cystathionine gamma-lyase
MVSLELEGDIGTAQQFARTTQLFHLAVSLGAVESLIEQPALMSHASYDPAFRMQHGIRDELIRLSIGLEDPDDLIADLEQALGRL